MTVVNRRRPWRVHVVEIGPNFSFSTEARARKRAEDLTREEYAMVHVYDIWEEFPLHRYVYRYGVPGFETQVFELGGDGWKRIEKEEAR